MPNPRPSKEIRRIRLATLADASRVAEMSRDLIEHGLGWNWTARRVAESIADADTNVILALEQGARIGFGIMKYRADDAHLLLLAVTPRYARRGFGCGLVEWLELSARSAGTARIHLEARQSNSAGIAFYRRLGYRESKVVAGYYRGVEASVRMVKDLRVAEAESA